MCIQDSGLNAQIDELLKAKGQQKSQLASETREKRRASSSIDRFGENDIKISSSRIKRQKMADDALVLGKTVSTLSAT